MRNPHIRGTRIIAKASHAIDTAHCLSFAFPSLFHTSALQDARLHKAVTTQNCMLPVSLRFHTAELHVARLIALPHRIIACYASHCPSTAQNCMLGVSLRFHIAKLDVARLIVLPQRRIAYCNSKAQHSMLCVSLRCTGRGGREICWLQKE